MRGRFIAELGGFQEEGLPCAIEGGGWLVGAFGFRDLSATPGENFSQCVESGYWRGGCIEAGFGVEDLAFFEVDAAVVAVPEREVEA